MRNKNTLCELHIQESVLQDSIAVIAVVRSLTHKQDGRVYPAMH